MIIKQLTCSACGANHLQETEPGRFRCEYCDAAYTIDYDGETGELEDASVRGNMLRFPLFAVHGRLLVSGNMNKIKLMSRHNNPNIRHVGNLSISGNMNKGKVVMLDGATYEMSGNMNEINDKR